MGALRILRETRLYLGVFQGLLNTSGLFGSTGKAQSVTPAFIPVPHRIECASSVGSEAEEISSETGKIQPPVGIASCFAKSKSRKTANFLELRNID